MVNLCVVPGGSINFWGLSVKKFLDNGIIKYKRNLYVFNKKIPKSFSTSHVKCVWVLKHIL